MQAQKEFHKKWLLLIFWLQPCFERMYKRGYTHTGEDHDTRCEKRYTGQTLCRMLSLGSAAHKFNSDRSYVRESTVTGHKPPTPIARRAPW